MNLNPKYWKYKDSIPILSFEDLDSVSNKFFREHNNIKYLNFYLILVLNILDILQFQGKLNYIYILHKLKRNLILNIKYYK